MKRLISRVLSVVIAISLLPLGTLTVSASTFVGGDGSPQNPYQISNVSQLMAIQNDLDANYVICNDITLTTKWNPISGVFTGVLDGKNFSVMGLSLNANEQVKTGFFEESKGEIKNLNFKNVILKGFRNSDDNKSVYYGIVSAVQSGGFIKNCHVSGNIRCEATIDFTDEIYVGGITGKSDDKSVIDNCNFEGAINIESPSEYITVRGGGISGSHDGKISNCLTSVDSNCDITLNKLNHRSNLFFGGIVGYGRTIEKCKTNFNIISTVCGSANIGGIAGTAYSGNIDSCVAINTIKCDANSFCKIGGITGLLNPGIVGGGVLKNSQAYCTIVCDKNNDTGVCYNKLIGGLVGETMYATICSSAFDGNISVYSHSNNASAGNVYLGGLVGQSTGSVIDNCYSMGEFYGESTTGTDASSRHFGDVNIGGLIGSFYNKNNTLTNCYFSGTSKGYADDKENIGAIFGEKFLGEYDIKNCYYNSDLIATSGQKEYAKSSNSLKSESTFVNWDFNKDWIIKSNFNDGYPTLRSFFEGLFIEGVNTIQNNKETNLKAMRYDENGNIAPEGGITWSCSDESVAQITPWGNNVTVKGLKGGKATITATHSESGQKADFEIEVVSYVMTLAGGYTVMLDEELEINYAVKQGEEYVHNDLDIKWEIESKDSNNAVKIISDKDNAYTRALTVKGINEGECELVAKVDGAELGRTKIEVLGNLAETINDETVIRAKYLVNNSQYKYYKNYDSVHRIFADSMDLTKATVNYSLNNFMEIARESVEEWTLPDKTSAVNFYEYALLKLLCAEENVKVFGKTGKIMEDYIIKYGSKIADAGTKITDEDKKWLKETCDKLCVDGIADIGFLDSILVSGKAISTFFEEFASVYRMSNCTELQINAIKQIRANATDSSLRTACDNVINYLKQSQVDTAKAAIALGMVKTGEQLLDYSMDTAISLAKKSNPILIAMDISLETSNFLFKAKDLSVDTLNIFALMHVEDALNAALIKAEKSFSNNSAVDNAQELIALADLYKNVQLYGCDICDSYLENYGKAIRNQGIVLDTIIIILKNVANREVKMSDVFNALFGNFDNDTLEKRATLARIRKLIDSANFYGSEGTDVAEFIREVKSTTPSEWAKSEIEKAKNYGFLPDYMQNNYQNNITRAEFCTILTWMIEEKTGKGIGQLIEENGTPIKSPFEDTYYEYADYMCKLGIVNGVSATEFNPLGEITREQAATMLMRTADVLGYDTSYNTSVESGVSSWATEGVGFVTEKGIMNGTGNGFEPQGKYTKEQAIATFVRMYDNLK